MASYKKFYTKGLDVKFFPEENVIRLDPDGMSKDAVRDVKERLETILNLKSSNAEKTQKGVAFSLEVDESLGQPSVEELLRSMFQGGDEVYDAGDLAKPEQDEEQQQAQMPQQQQQPMQQPQQGLQADISYAFAKMYKTYLVESRKRSAEFWDELKQPAGRASKNEITEDDLLRVREQYTRKPQTEERDRILQATDKAFKYFLRKIRNEQGDREHDEFKQRYHSIGDLSPADYGGDEYEVDDESPTIGDGEESQEQVQKALDFTEFFKGDEEEDIYQNKE